MIPEALRAPSPLQPPPVDDFPDMLKPSKKKRRGVPRITSEGRWQPAEHDHFTLPVVNTSSGRRKISYYTEDGVGMIKQTLFFVGRGLGFSYTAKKSTVMHTFPQARSENSWRNCVSALCCAPI